jgi:hypothetical protein
VAPILLVVFGERDTTMGLFNIAARQALSLLQEAIVSQRVHTVRNARRTQESGARGGTQPEPGA